MTGQVTILQVQERVTERYGLPSIAMRAESRRRGWTRPRQIAMALAHELTGCSSTRIGRAFARDHTTVLHAIWRIDNLCRQNPAFAREVQAVRVALEENA